MESVTKVLYELCSVDMTSDEPVIFIDEQTALYFFENNTGGIDITCPISLIPDDPELLKKILKYNAVLDVTLAANEDASLLLAIKFVPEESNKENLQDAINCLVGVVSQLRSELQLSPWLSDE